MRQERLQLRPNHYPDGPYYESVCIWCKQRLKHTGAWSGTTWIPVATPPDGRPRDWWTCWSNEVARATYGQHEPWEAIPIRTSEEDTCPTT